MTKKNEPDQNHSLFKRELTVLHRIAFALLVSAGVLWASTCHAQVEWTVISPEGKKPAIKVVSETFFRFRYIPGSYKPKALSARVFLTNGTIVGDLDGLPGMGSAVGGGAPGMGGMGMGSPGGGMGAGMGMGGSGGGGEMEGYGEPEPSGLELFAIVVEAKNAEGENATNVQIIFNKDTTLFGYPGYGMGGMGAGMDYGSEEGGYGGFSGGGGYGDGGGDGGYPGGGAGAPGAGGVGDGVGSGFGAARPGDGKRKALGEYYELESLLQPKVAKRTLGSRYKLAKQELKIVKDFIQLAVLRNVLLDEIKEKKSDADFLAEAEKKLKEILSSQYTNQLARQKIEIEAIESKVEKLRSELDRREAAKDRVVDVQVGRIILEAQGLLDN